MTFSPSRIFAIDPGNIHSAYVLYCPRSHTVLQKGKVLNELLRRKLNRDRHNQNYIFVIEMIKSYGMAVGASVFDTCIWIGRFTEILERAGREVHFMGRKDAVIEICHCTKAKDSNVRTALIDLFPATGGGATPQIGTKKEPGPLFGMAKDTWAALAVAIAFHKKQKGENDAVST